MESKSAKEFVEMVAENKQVTIQELSTKIGRPKVTLGHSLRNDTLSVTDLRKCLEATGQALVIVFKNKKYKIEAKSLK